VLASASVNGVSRFTIFCWCGVLVEVVDVLELVSLNFPLDTGFQAYLILSINPI